MAGIGIPEDVDSFPEQELEDSGNNDFIIAILSPPKLNPPPPHKYTSIESIVSNPRVDDNEAQRRELVKHQRQKRGRGLSFLAKEVVDKFNKVAVSREKVSAKEQVKSMEKNYIVVYHIYARFIRIFPRGRIKPQVSAGRGTI